MNIEEDDISVILKTDIQHKIPPHVVSTPGPICLFDGVFGAWLPARDPPSWWSTIAGSTAWPPLNFVAKPTWWPNDFADWPSQTILPPEVIINDPSGVQLFDEETQECKILLASVGMNITEDDDGISFSFKTDIQNQTLVAPVPETTTAEIVDPPIP